MWRPWRHGWAGPSGRSTTRPWEPPEPCGIRRPFHDRAPVAVGTAHCRLRSAPCRGRVFRRGGLLRGDRPGGARAGGGAGDRGDGRVAELSIGGTGAGQAYREVALRAAPRHRDPRGRAGGVRPERRPPVLSLQDGAVLRIEEAVAGRRRGWLSPGGRG